MPPAPHIVTISGRKVYPFAPHADQIDPMDIAHSLSFLNRFNGHTSQPYSVAQHSLLVAEILGMKGESAEVQTWGLLHDGAEAYLGDVIPQLKSRMVFTFSPYQVSFREVEAKLQMAIAERFGLCWPMPRAVKKADQIALANEIMELRPDTPGKLDGLPKHPLPSGLGDWPFYQWHQVRDLLFARLQVHLERIAA